MKIYNSPDLNNLPIKNPLCYSEDEINALFDLSEEEAVELTKVISNQVAINKVYSSQKTEERLAEILIEANQFATEQLGKSNFLSIDLATSIDEVVDEHILYLIADESGNNTYNQYVLIGGEVKSLGSTQCDLSNYVTNDQLETKLEDYAKKNEVVSASNIVTTIDDSVTNDQVIGALAVKEKFDEVFQNVDNGKDLIASAITDKGVDTSKDDTFETMANNISSIIQSGDINVIHNAMESLGYDYTDLSRLNIDDTARLISKCFILKQASENVSNIMSATSGVNFDNFLIDGKLQDFGNVINPVYTKETINQTKNTVNNVFVSDDISVELINVYMGGV